MLEQLENRLLMRGGVVSMSGHTVYVSGTAGDDVINLAGTPQHFAVTLNGKRHAFTLKHVHKVIVYAGAGDDKVTSSKDNSGTKDLDLPSSVDGGAGNDSLYAGLKSDTLLGGSGRDRLYGNDLDYLDGGSGNDRLVDGGTINGGSGTDVAYGLPSAVVSGLETFYNDVDDDSPRPGPVTYDTIDPSAYVGDLKTRGSQLVFRYPTSVGHDYSLSAPTGRSDGMLQVTLKSQDAASDYVPPKSALTVNLPRDDAVRFGVVFVDASGTERTVLLPSATGA